MDEKIPVSTWMVHMYSQSNAQEGEEGLEFELSEV